MDFVDVYGFAGGFACGMTQAGFTLRGKREGHGGFGVANMERNRQLLGAGWETEVASPEEWTPLNTPVIAGNPPCSGFSMMSEPSFRGINSKVNACMWALVDYASRCKGVELVAFESVQGAFTKGYELMSALHADLERRTGKEWRLHHVLHDGFSVGGSQANRRRYFWVATTGAVLGVEPADGHKPTLSEIIGDLQPLELSWRKQSLHIAPSSYNVKHDIVPQPLFTRTAAFGNPEKTVVSLSAVDGHIDVRNPMNDKITELANFGDWQPRERMQDALKRHHERYGSFPPGYAQKYCDKMLATEFNMGFTQPFRWAYDEPPRVIHGGAMYISVHPEEARCLTHRECARIMGFPDKWQIEPLQDIKGLPLTWGKGIAVQAGRWLGDWISASLAGRPGSEQGTRVGDREYVIDVTSTRYRKPSQWKKVPAA